MALEVNVRHEEGVPIVSATGQIDMNNYVEVHELLTREITEGHVNIILDLKQLNFMDSATLGMLLRSLDKAKEHGGTIVIVSNPFVDRVLSVTGLTHLFEIYITVRQALDRFRPAESAS